MRLLYLSADPGVPVLGHKGASVHLRELVGAFCAAGATITVASPRVRPEGDELGSEAELVEIEPVLPRSYPTLAALRRAVALQAGQVESIARERRADAVYERLSLFGESGLRAARRLGLPHVLELNAPLYEEALRFRSLPFAAAAEQIERDVCAGTDHAFAVSATLAERLPHGKVSVASNGIDLAKFAAPRRRHEGFTVGFAGSLKPWHGVGVLLEAFALTLERDPALRLEIVGTGPEAVAVEHAGLPSGRFTYHGALPHTATIEVLRGWDAGLAPFLPMPGFYFSPLKVAEYMAAGVCPIASDLGELGELLGRGERGVLVEPGNAEGLADAILAAAEEHELTHTRGARARAFALGAMTWRRNAERALDVLERLRKRESLVA